MPAGIGPRDPLALPRPCNSRKEVTMAAGIGPRDNVAFPRPKQRPKVTK